MKRISIRLAVLLSSTVVLMLSACIADEADAAQLATAATGLHTGSATAVHMQLKNSGDDIICKAYNTPAFTKPKAQCPGGTWNEQLFDINWKQIGSNKTVTVGTPSNTNNTYFDDTYRNDINVKSRQSLLGYFDYESYLLSGVINEGAYERFTLETNPSGNRHVLDATESNFLVDNNDESVEPNEQRSNTGAIGLGNCEDGSQLTNTYPFIVRDSGVTVLGGIFHGYFPKSAPHVGIPQSSTWAFSYCNSATITFKNAERGYVDGARITSSWDAVRPGAHFVVENSWFSRVRDDTLENDSNAAGIFQDNLVDNAFQGISSKDGDVNGSSQTVQVLGNVIKLRSYAYKVIDGEAEQYFGALFKYDDKAPSTVVKDTVIAVEPDALRAGGSTNTFYDQWDQGWDSISSCGNNIFLWLSEDDSYRAVQDRVTRDMPGCFKVETGAKAKDIWNQAQQNWVDCHPRVGRAKGDPLSNFSRCRAKDWGGYSYSD